MQKINPCIWFDGKAEEAANFYVSTFKNGKMGTIYRTDAEAAKVSGQPEGSVLSLEVEIEGVTFTFINGGKLAGFELTSGVSFMVNCETQDEIDRLWDALAKAEGSQVQQCGWCIDKFGVTWQIVPRILNELLSSPDKTKAMRVMHAMLQMEKLIIADLEAAAQSSQ